MEITKRDAANRQLNEAIRLFFEGRDPVAIHTLVGAASLVISDLVQVQNPGASWDTKAQADNALDPRSFYRVMRKSQNFFKHARDDPDGVLQFDPTETPSQIMFATLNNGELGGPLSMEQSFFQLWYLACFHKDIEWDPELIPNALRMFGDLSGLDSAIQVQEGLRIWQKHVAA